MKKAKVLAWLMATSLGAASLGNTAYAASFTEFAQSSYETLMENFEQNYELALTQAAAESGKVDINLRLGDTGKAMLAMMAPVDLSWINDVNIALASKEDPQAAFGNMTLALNSADLLTANFQIDLDTLRMYMQVPDLSDAVLTADYLQLVNMAMQESGGSVPLTEEQLKEIIKICKNLSENPPSADVVKTLLDRYWGVIMTAYENGETYQEIIDVRGITEQTTVLEGIITEEKALGMAKNLLGTLKDDAEVKGLIETILQGTSFQGMLYEQMQSGLAGALESLENETVSEGGETLVLRFWVNAENVLVGEQFAMKSGEYEQPMVTCQWAEEDNNWAFNMDINAGTSVVLGGTGTIENGQALGNLQLVVDSTPYVDIAVEQTADAEQLMAGTFHGSYTVTPIIPEVKPEEEPVYSPMSSFNGMSANLTVDSQGTTGSVELSVSMSGAPLAYLTITSDAAYQGGEYVDLSTSENFVELTDEEQLNAFAASLDPQALLGIMTARLTAAGMPEGFIENLMAQTGMGAAIEEDYGTEVEDVPAVEESAPEPAVEENPAEGGETTGTSAGGTLGLIGSAAAPVIPAEAEEEVEETTEEAGVPGLMDWNNGR